MKIDIDKLYTFSNFKARCIYHDPMFIDGDKYLLELYQDDSILTDKNKEVCIVLVGVSLKLEYIGIQEKFRGGVLKQLHKNCYDILRASSFEEILLKPLSSVLTMWVYLGFDFIKPIEAIRARVTLISYLKSKNIIKEIDIVRYDKMSLKDIVSTHKEAFKQSEFPKLIEKELYYTNLRKGVK
ncbi:MAG: hypothetical protein U9P72_12105 [Campylobacterota bacterium]|nr:hypothetical protein [Campylobacterota bacterium]